MPLHDRVCPWDSLVPGDIQVELFAKEVARDALNELCQVDPGTAMAICTILSLPLSDAVLISAPLILARELGMHGVTKLMQESLYDLLCDLLFRLFLVLLWILVEPDIHDVSIPTGDAVILERALLPLQRHFQLTHEPSGAQALRKQIQLTQRIWRAPMAVQNERIKGFNHLRERWSALRTPLGTFSAHMVLYGLRDLERAVGLNHQRRSRGDWEVRVVPHCCHVVAAELVEEDAMEEISGLHLQTSGNTTNDHLTCGITVKQVQTLQKLTLRSTATSPNNCLNPIY